MTTHPGARPPGRMFNVDARDVSEALWQMKLDREKKGREHGEAVKAGHAKTKRAAKIKMPTFSWDKEENT